MATGPVRPCPSGPPATKPMTPADSRQAAGSWGAPVDRCRMPRAASPMSSDPRTWRIRASGRDWCRNMAMPVPNSTTGTTAAARPAKLRSATSTHSPTGPPARHHTPAAVTIANAINTMAAPSLRCAGSRSRVRPTALAMPPTPRASTDQPPRTPLGRLFFRAAAERDRVPDRVPPDFDEPPFRFELRPVVVVRPAMPHTVVRRTAGHTNHNGPGSAWDELVPWPARGVSRLGDLRHCCHAAASWLHSRPGRPVRHREPGTPSRRLGRSPLPEGAGTSRRSGGR